MISLYRVIVETISERFVPDLGNSHVCEKNGVRVHCSPAGHYYFLDAVDEKEALRKVIESKVVPLCQR